MKGKSLFWMYILFAIVVLIDLKTLGIRYDSPFDEFVFYATIIVAAFSFLMYSINFNLSSFFLLNAFFLNIFLITLEIVNGQRSMLIALSCILSLIGVIGCILKIGPEPKKRVFFPEPTPETASSDKDKRQLQSKKDAIEKEIGVSSLKKPSVEPYKDFEDNEEDIEDFKHDETENKTVKTLLKEIEQKAEELNQEIKGIVSKKHKPIAVEAEDIKNIEETKETEKDKQQDKKASYVAGRNSEYYHSLDCPVAKRLTKKRFYDSKEKAEAAGLKPHICVR